MRKHRRSFALRKQERVEDLEASVAYFSNENKPARERHVVDDLLRNLGTRFRIAEIESVPVREEPPDVRFRSAAFEVKEILDDSRRRHAEYKGLLEGARRARSYKHLWHLSQYTPRDISLSDLLEEAAQLSGRVLRKYSLTAVRELDLLVYYNRLDVIGLDERHFPPSDPRLGGWRSVTVVIGYRAIVFFTTPKAPLFLRRAVGQVRHRPMPRRRA
jgi:hypothetical protein